MTIHIQYVILIQLIHNKQAVFGSLAEFVKQYFQGLETPYQATKFIGWGWEGEQIFYMIPKYNEYNNTVQLEVCCSS